MIKFATLHNFDPPPSDELIFHFLTDLFINTPSGQNYRIAIFAIRSRCKIFLIPDPTNTPRINLLIKGMCNLSLVYTKRERDPWSLDFIRKWIEVGQKFVSIKVFNLYTSIMIIGLRTMFRGSELGGLLMEDIKFVVKPTIGFRLTARKIKNNPKGRTACVEATFTGLCPLCWLKRFISTRDAGPYLFGASCKLGTVEISWILKQVVVWIQVEGNTLLIHLELVELQKQVLRNLVKLPSRQLVIGDQILLIDTFDLNSLVKGTSL